MEGIPDLDQEITADGSFLFPCDRTQPSFTVQRVTANRWFLRDCGLIKILVASFGSAESALRS